MSANALHFCAIYASDAGSCGPTYIYKSQTCERICAMHSDGAENSLSHLHVDTRHGGCAARSTKQFMHQSSLCVCADAKHSRDVLFARKKNKSNAFRLACLRPDSLIDEPPHNPPSGAAASFFFIRPHAFREIQ